MEYIQKNLRYSFYEVNEILTHMPIEYSKKVPEKLKQLLNENKESNGFIYNENKTLDNQEILHDTEILLSVIYRNYWCSEERKRVLENEDIKLLNEKYSLNNLFQKQHTTEKLEEQFNKNQLSVIKKESILKKIIEKIKRFLK